MDCGGGAAGATDDCGGAGVGAGAGRAGSAGGNRSKNGRRGPLREPAGLPDSGLSSLPGVGTPTLKVYSHGGSRSGIFDGGVRDAGLRFSESARER